MKELKEFLGFFIGMLNWAGNSLADGKIDWTEKLGLGSKLVDAVKALKGINKIKEEWLSLTSADLEDLHDWINEEFDIPQEMVEEFLEDFVELIFRIIPMYSKGKNDE